MIASSAARWVGLTMWEGSADSCERSSRSGQNLWESAPLASSTTLRSLRRTASASTWPAITQSSNSAV